MRRRAFSLIEVAFSVAMLAIAVPAVLELMGAAAADRADAVNTTRAVLLATMVAETVIADTASSHSTLGFDALNTPSTYLDDPAGGLRARLQDAAEPYASLGMRFEVDLGPLVGADAQTDADPDNNLFRVVTVRVRYPSASGAELEMPLSVVVGGV